LNIKKSIVFSFAIAILSVFISSNAHAGAAVCIAKQDTPRHNQTDVEYFARWGGNVDGYKADHAARGDYKQKYSRTPTCRNTGRQMNGYFVVIKNVRQNYAHETTVTYAFGYGRSRGEAEHDAVEEMGRRNWSWKKSEGYTVDMARQF
jgi:hypothetical protein